MIILGVDPGTRVTGYGVIIVQDNKYKILDYGCIKPPANLKITDKYLIIFEGLDEIIQMHKPTVLSVETQFVARNAQSALKLGMARGTAFIAAKRRGLPVYEYSPSRAKKAVSGNGHASKSQVQRMVQMLLELEEPPQPEDAADALALAICHAQCLRWNQIIDTEI